VVGDASKVINYIAPGSLIRAALTADDKNGNQVTVYSDPITVTASAVTYAGADRYETAVAANESTSWGGAGIQGFDNSANNGIVLAAGSNNGMVDALSASGLAGILQAPVYLADVYNVDVAASIVKALPVGSNAISTRKDVLYVVGGSVPNNVIQQYLTYIAQNSTYYQKISMDNVKQFVGTDRYDTAAKVAAFMYDQKAIDAATPATNLTDMHPQASTQSTAYVARGDNQADALVASASAYSSHIPIMLTTSTMLPSETATELTALHTANPLYGVTLLGGEAAISGATNPDGTPGVQAQITSQCGITQYSRIGGVDRYDTAAQFANINNGKYPGASISVASGESMVDALVAGPVVGKHGGSLLINPSTGISPYIKAAIANGRWATTNTTYSDGLASNSLTVFGGKDAIDSTDLVTAFDNIVYKQAQ
jgi:putative cell wall-binding protein